MVSREVCPTFPAGGGARGGGRLPRGEPPRGRWVKRASAQARLRTHPAQCVGLF